MTTADFLESLTRAPNDDEEEGYKFFTEESHKRLKERKRELQKEKELQNSAAKQEIFKGVNSQWPIDGLDIAGKVPLKPEKSLEDGQEMPQVYGKFPKEMHYCPIEDVDIYYTDQGHETFCVVAPRFGKNYIYRFSAKNGFFIFSPFLHIRKLAIRTVLHFAFDTAVMMIILINCVFLALDNEIPNAEYVFTGLYTIEMILKMIARGLFLNKFTYLRDPWNWLDFVVVILAYATIVGTANVSSLRTFRVFRAFKSVSIVPGLKTIVNSLFNSMKPLAEVMLIMCFLLIVISLIALQAYQGILTRRCVLVPVPDGLNFSDQIAYQAYVSNSSNWLVDEGETQVCGNSTGSGFCPNGYICLQDVAPNPNYGYTNFDNMAYSLLTSFQLITLDFWENVYNMILRAEGPWNILFFLMSVFLGPFYLLNLLLAVVTLAYCREHDKQEELEEKRMQAKEIAKTKHRRRKRLQEFRNRTNQNAISPEAHKPNLADITAMLPSSQSEKKFVIDDTLAKKISSNDNLQTNNYIQHEVNGDASHKREMFKKNNHNTSLDSTDSSQKKAGKWHKRWISFKKWYMETFCSWSCCPCFKWFQRRLLKFIEYKAFEYFIMLCILVNTGFLAADHYNISPEVEFALSTGNTVFTGIFTLEAILKLLAMGPITYAKDPWNDFDFIIVFISLIEVTLDVVGSSSGTNGLTVLRTLRLLRVFRLAKMWTTMNKLMVIIWKSISAVAYLTVVLFLVLYIFAVIGKQLYAQNYKDSAPLFDGSVPRWNFTDFYHSFLLVWRVMCGEWIEPLYDCLHATNGTATCYVVFLSIIFVANFMILNLFTAILLEAFTVDGLKGEKKKEKEKKQTEVARKAAEAFKRNVEKQKSKRKETDQDGNGSNIVNNLDTDETIRVNSEVSETTFSREGRPKLYKQPSLCQLSTNGHLNEADIQKLDESSNCDHSLRTDNDNMGIGSSHPANQPSKSNWLCQKFCCCTKSRVTEAKSVSVVSSRHASESECSEKTQTNSDQKNNKDIKLPDFLPKWVLKRFPSLNRNSHGQVYTYWMGLRKACFLLVEHKFFEWFILFLILASTVSLAMEDIYLDSEPIKKLILEKLEYIFTTLFTIEMVLKWIGLGPANYFTNPWCLLDCVIVAVSWVGIILQATAQSSQTGALRSLRTLRALRPLRAVSRWQGMKIVVNALFYCIPSIGNVILVCLLIWLVFGIMGVQFFKGQFFRCVDAEDNIITNLTVVSTKAQCLQRNYRWVDPHINFNNAINAMVALFQVATFEGWLEVMADASDVRGIDMQPVKEHSQYYMIFFVFFVLVGSFFILNLIVGVIIESFQNLRKQSESSSSVEALLTDTQKQFYKTMKTMLNRKPKKLIPPPTNCFQMKIFNLVTHNSFEMFIFSLIVLNMVSLSMEHYKMSDAWKNALEITDMIFTSLFAAEAILKMIGMRCYYFTDAFNCFDLLVICASITGFILDSLISLVISPTMLRIIRVFRVFRVLRVVRAARGIRRLVVTLMISIPALFNIAVLLSVFLIIFAILGMTLFSQVKLMGAINNQVNFQTFGNSLLVLFRLVTSAGWNDVMDSLMNTENCSSPGSADFVCNGSECNGCGDPVMAVIYFVAFIFIVFLVVVNMYIAIILENFDDIFQQDVSGVSQGDFEAFYQTWGRYDPKATQFVTLKELSNFLNDLKPPLQIPKPNEVKIAALDLPVLIGERVHCLDVLFALVKRILGEVEIPEEMKKEAEVRLLKSFPNRKVFETKTTTMMLRKQTKAAKIIQEAWKAFCERKHKGNSFLQSSSPSNISPSFADITQITANTKKDDETKHSLSTIIQVEPASSIDNSTVIQEETKVPFVISNEKEQSLVNEPEKSRPSSSFSRSSRFTSASKNNNNGKTQGDEEASQYVAQSGQPASENEQDIEEIPLVIQNQYVIDDTDIENQANQRPSDSIKSQNIRPKSVVNFDRTKRENSIVRPLSSSTSSKTSVLEQSKQIPQPTTKPKQQDNKLFHTRQLQDFVKISKKS